MDNLQQHFTYTFADQVRETRKAFSKKLSKPRGNKIKRQHIDSRKYFIKVCQPLFEAFDVNYFSYTRVYRDNTFFALTSDTNWLHYCLKNNYLVGNIAINSGIHLWQDYLPIIVESAKKFGYYNGVTIFNNIGHYVECCDLATPKDHNQAIDFYFNHLELIKKFIAYFKIKAAKLIKYGAQNRRSLTDTNVLQLLKTLKNSYSNFHKNIKINKIPLFFNDREIIFAKREYECLMGVVRGQTINQIAGQLELSPRTIEFYINNIKRKTGCRSRAHLTGLAWQNHHLFVENYYG